MKEWYSSFFNCFKSKLLYNEFMDIYVINRGFTIIRAKIRALELESIRKNKLDVSDVQWNYLIWLSESKGIKMNELANKLGVQKGTLSNNIKVLISKKLITKEDIGRITLITPTKKGLEYIELHRQTHILIGK